MNNSRVVNIALKRLSKDLTEITNEPQNGIGIGPFESNSLKYLVNMKLLNGVYSGLCLQLILTFPDTYPINPPEIKLMPNQGFDNKYHHHIYDTGFCFDLLANRYLSVKDKQTGWTSSYTLSSLLLQVQIFLSDPDFPPGAAPPSKKDVEELFNNQKDYEVSFAGDSNEVKVHTWGNPYPKMHEIVTQPQPQSNQTAQSSADQEEPIIPSNKPTIFYNEETDLKENLTCSVLKTSYIEDHEVTLGYPIIKFDKSFYPIPEMLSYEAYVNHIQNEELKLDHYFNVKYKSSMGEFYNCWFPIYINDEHYSKNKEKILNALTVIEHGASGKKKYDFNPQYVFNVFPRLLNTMIMGLFQNTNVISEAFLCCYFHFVLLFKKLMTIFAKDIKASDYIIPALKLIKQWETINSRQRDSFHFEDSLILLLFSGRERNENAEKLLITYLMKENIMHVIDNGQEARQKLIELVINQKAIEYFDKNDDAYLGKEFFRDFKHWSELYEILKDDYHLKSTFEMNKGTEFGSLSKKVANDPNIVQVDLYGDFDFFSSAKEEVDNNDEPIQYTDYSDYADFFNEIKEKFISNQHKTLALCTKERKERVYSLLQTNYAMSNYMNAFSPEEAIRSIRTASVKRLLEISNHCTLELFMNYVYSKNPKNQMLLIMYITKQYFSNEAFMKTLEKNYGVLLQDQLYKVKHELSDAQESIHNFTALLKKIHCSSYVKDEFEFYQQIYS